MSDLFGHPEPPQRAGAKTDAERRRERRRASERPRGYAAPPGSGPVGETCGSCKHHVKHIWSKTYHKCDLIHPTKGPGTDIRVRSPACSRWEAKDESVAS